MAHLDHIPDNASPVAMFFVHGSSTSVIMLLTLRLDGFAVRIAAWKIRGQGANQADFYDNSTAIGAFPAKFLQWLGLPAVGSGSIITEVELR